MGKKVGIVEKIAITARLLPKETDEIVGPKPEAVENESGELSSYPPLEKWDHWVEFDSKQWPKRVSKEYQIIPTTCFNCEAACGLVAYVDKATDTITKFQGNPLHPASRGRNCAKGPATINQINDPHRILYPLKRDGPRGSGKWTRVTWDEVIADISFNIRKRLLEDKHNEIVYQVGRPGHEGFMQWLLQAWGIDGHNSHTNICSSGARLGYALWHKEDRPSPDFTNSKFILLISAHLESGHYFNPHAQRIIEAKMKGTKIAVLDPRLSNTASMADYWFATYPGTEPVMLLAMAKIILDEGLYNTKFLKEWTNWQTYLAELHPKRPMEFEQFIEALKEDYAEYTLDYVAGECKIDASQVREIALNIGRAGEAFSYHNWRAASSGNLGGWQTARCLHFLAVLVGAVGTVGGTSPNSWQKFHPHVHASPPPHKKWNELSWPKEYPLSHYELGFMLPHLIKDGRGKLGVYFSRVFNPVWTNPDGFTWWEVLSDEKLVNMHIALTPTWNETAYLADYVLPMGHASERHDITSYETHSGTWISLRQPVMREYLRRQGKPVEYTYEANVGEVWEEDEFWINLTWNIDPDGKLGIRQYVESLDKPGTMLTIDEYYRRMFEHVAPVVEAAKEAGMDVLEFMRKVGSFEVEKYSLGKHNKELKVSGKTEVVPNTNQIKQDGKFIGVATDKGNVVGFNTPSRKQEIFSTTMKDWGWPEYTTPGYIKSHIHWENMDEKKNEIVLVPTFRLPALIHSRSGNAKWLAELHHRNPVWINPKTAKKYGVKTGDLVRVTTDIGYFVNRVWLTEGIQPHIIACSHHIGRWRRDVDPMNNVWAINTVDMTKDSTEWKISHQKGINPMETSDPDSSRIWYRDGGVHQNITFPVHPDPISGMHCWHQKVTLTKALPNDKYGDISVDTEKSMEVYREWLKMTRFNSPDGTRRPLWMKRPFAPDPSLYNLEE